MRRGLLIIVGVAAVAGLGAWLWPRADASGPTPTEAVLPEFAAVDVRAAAGQQALTLTGTVRDSGGQPIAGAEVSLASSNQRSLSDSRCGICGELLLSCRADETTRTVASLLDARRGELTAALTTTSDADGRFRFEQLAGTSFTVWARAAGFGEGIKERAAPGDPVELFLPAPRSIDGALRDEAGAPVKGRVRVVSMRLARPVEVDSDAEGRFEVDGLGEGPFYVGATAPGLLPGRQLQVDPGAGPVTVTLRAPRRLEVRLVSGEAPVDGVVFLGGDHLTRELSTKGGFLAVDGLYPGEVLVRAVAGDLSAAPQTVTLSEPVTRVTLKLERGGRLAVTVVDEAEQPVPSPTVEVYTRGGEQVLSQKLQTGELALLGPLGAGQYVVRVTAEGFEELRLQVTLAPKETPLVVTLVHGTLISGRVLDEYGRPAPGISVLVTPTGDNVLADDEGRFKAAVPSPGLYRLHAHHSDWGGGEVDVTAPKQDVELHLDPGAGVEVTVTADGRRVEGASVLLLHAQGNYRNDRLSGADGVVVMRGLPPDTYTLVATHPDMLPSERSTFTLGPNEQLELSAVLKAGVSLEGQVVDTEDAPVANVVVTVAPRGAEPATTDATGHFTLKPLRPGITYAVRVAERGYEQVERTLATAGGEPVRVVVRRQPRFKGRVLGDGQPVKSFRVDEHEVNSPDGRFELPLSESNGRVIVIIDAPGFEPLMTDRPSAPDLGDFTLTRAPQVTGVVREAGGVPVADAIVTCESCDQSVLSGPDGTFSLRKPAFQREFNLVARKGRRSVMRVVSDEAIEGVELTLEPGIKVTGSAWFPDGRPAAGVEVAGANIDRGETLSIVTGADGSFSTEAPAGTYRFVLIPPAGPAQSVDPLALITQISEQNARVDLGPSPALARLAVHLRPQPGYALWLVRGDLPAVGDPPMELLHAAYAQLVYQPRVDTIVFGGLTPGRYTVVWGSFHMQTEDGVLRVPVDVPAQAEVSLER